MNVTTKIFEAIQILLHKEYFEKTYSNSEARYIDFCIERDDEELLKYEEKLKSYLVYIAIYDRKCDEKIYKTWERISFTDINKMMKNPDFKKLYKEAKISEM